MKGLCIDLNGADLSYAILYEAIQEIECLGGVDICLYSLNENDLNWVHGLFIPTISSIYFISVFDIPDHPHIKHIKFDINYGMRAGKRAFFSFLIGSERHQFDIFACK
jgi:hypothetical protein